MSIFQKGKYPLTLDSYNQIFANFLIGKTPYGPGRFIFGCFEHMAQRTEFQLIHGPGEDILGNVLIYIFLVSFFRSYQVTVIFLLCPA